MPSPAIPTAPQRTALRGPCGALALASALAAGCGPHPSDPMETGPRRSQAALTSCPSGAVLQGVDVSGYDGAVDWRAAASGGIRFGIARISDGTAFPDSTFPTNWAAMLDAGVIRGAYQFFEANDDITAEANLVVQAVGVLGPTDLPVTVDVEDEPSGAFATVAQLQSWMSIVQQGTGKVPMVYSSARIWAEPQNSAYGTNFAANPLWVANWPDLDAGPACAKMPAVGWDAWTLWQYSATGTVPGLSGSRGAADLDEFNGSLADLLAFTSAPLCTGLHADCSASSECCSGLTCQNWSASGANPVPVCCDGVGATCTHNSDCCGGSLCASSICACVPAGQYCANDADCCSGLSCQSAACNPTGSSATAASSRSSSSTSAVTATGSSTATTPGSAGGTSGTGASTASSSSSSSSAASASGTVDGNAHPDAGGGSAGPGQGCGCGAGRAETWALWAVALLPAARRRRTRSGDPPLAANQWTHPSNSRGSPGSA
jgi:lysozyme